MSSCRPAALLGLRRTFRSSDRKSRTAICSSGLRALPLAWPPPLPLPADQGQTDKLSGAQQLEINGTDPDGFLLQEGRFLLFFRLLLQLVVRHGDDGQDEIE